MLILLFLVSASATTTTELYNVSGAHRFDESRVCHLYQRDSSIYLQLENIRTTELSTPYDIASSSNDCLEQPQTCFMFEDYAYSLTRNACTNWTRMVKGATNVFHFSLPYDLLRFDYTKGVLYILRKPILFGIEFSDFLSQNYTCKSVVRRKVDWDDFLVANDELFYLVNGTLYSGSDYAVMRADYLPYALFPKSTRKKEFPWLFIIGYVLEFVFLSLLLYLFGDRFFKRYGPIKGMTRRPLLINGSRISRSRENLA